MYCWLNIKTIRDWRQAGAAKETVRRDAEDFVGAGEAGSFDNETLDQPGACMRRLVESRDARFRQGASAGLQVGILVSPEFIAADPARLTLLRDRGLAWAKEKFGAHAIAAWRLVPERATPRLELFVTPIVERKGRGGAPKREVAVSHIMGKPHERKLSLMQDQLAAAFADLGLERRRAANAGDPAPIVVVQPEPRTLETPTDLARRSAAVTERERIAALREGTLQSLTNEVHR